MKNTVNQDIDAALAEEAEGQHEDIEAEDKNSMRGEFYDAMSSFAHKAATRLGKTPQPDATAAIGMPGAPVGFQGVPAREVAQGEMNVAGEFVQSQLTSGAAPSYAHKMMEPDSPEQAANLEQMGGIYSPKVEKGVEMMYGAAEWAGWGKLFGGVGRSLKPFTRMLPEGLAAPLRGSIAGGSLSGGTEALSERWREGQTHGKDIAEATALGALLGAAAGSLPEDEMQAVQKNLPKFTEAAGGTYQQSIREMQRAAARVGGRDWSNQVAFNKLAKFAQGSGDQAVAAKIRLLSKSEPELFKTPIMQKILRAAGRDDAGAGAPAVPPLKPGEVKRALMPEQTGEVVTQEGAPPIAGAKRGPLGIPLEQADPAKPVKGKQPAVAANNPKTPEWQEKALKFLGDYDPEAEKPADTPMRKQLAFLATSGQLKPEMITVGKTARKVSRVLAKTARELEKGEQPGFGEAYDAMGVWSKRARALDGATELDAKPVDPTSPTEMKQLRDEVDKGRETETTAAGPAKREMTTPIKNQPQKPVTIQPLTPEEKAIFEIEKSKPGIDYYSLGDELNKRGLHKGEVQVPGPDMERWRATLEDIKAGRLTKNGRKTGGGRFC